ncbi:MAG: hypothetical protein RLZZ76_154 [Candidatus Parcubacteria bacterium]|jgi:mRNA interferase MazF
MDILTPKRGEVWWVDFGASIGSEVKKVRPAIVVSNNNSNKHIARFQVVPLTSNIQKLYPGECLVTIKGQQGKALANQLSTIDKIRLYSNIATLTEEDMTLVEESICLQLGLE